MGVEHRVWIIPQARAFHPTAEQVANFANALREGNWVPRPAAQEQRSKAIELLPGIEGPLKKRPIRTEEFTAEPFTSAWVESHNQHELMLEWRVDNMSKAGVQYPFVFDPFPGERPPYFDIQLLLGDEYFSYSGENVMPFADQTTQCECGEQLAYDGGWSPVPVFSRIHRICPQCGRTFDPSDITCDVLDGFTGEPEPLVGGLAFRFALVVDCGKYYPREKEAMRRFDLRPEFLDLWRTHIRVSFEQVRTWD
jgi:hypothetical protein